MVMEGSSRSEVTRNETSDENSPLLVREAETDLQLEQELEEDIQSEVQSKYDELSKELFPSFSRKRFYFACGLGIVALIVLHLFFLQRTSWSRDFRRWYGLHLTGSDVKRNYLRYSGIGNKTELKIMQLDIENWFKNFTKLNERSSTNLLSSDNLELTDYIQSNFKKFEFETSIYSYQEPNLQKPINSSIHLIDLKSKNNNKLIYNANLFEIDFETPAYHGFGKSGNITGDYIFANYGTNKDFQLLLNSNFTIKNKIVILKSNLTSPISIAEKVSLAESYGAIGVINYVCPLSTLSPANLNLFSMAIPRGTLNNPYSSKIPTIPAIPISYKSIKPILDTLLHETDPLENWEYYPVLKSNTFKINMAINFENSSSRTLTNIIGKLPGIFQDGYIVIGANRDSLVSSSGLSNHVILLEIMRNFQRLLHLGWKPLRTIKFVSWDGTENGLLGSLKFTNDSNLINNQPVVGYINIDSSCVTGKKFEVNANPLTHHLIKFNSEYIPLPKSLFDDASSLEKDNFSNLHEYWLKQDNLTINDHLGIPIKDSDSLIFQDDLAAPIINLKFSNDPRRDGSVYVPNSNLYSYDWMMKTNLDPQYHLHALLIRLIGLLTISLSEREMVDYRTKPYFKQILNYYQDFIDSNKKVFNQWKNMTVPTNLVSNWQIYQDLNLENPEIIRFSGLINQLRDLINLDIKSSQINDEYNVQVQQDLQTDFSWYKYPSKLVKYAQFKVANYQLLHMEREMKLSNKDIQYLEYETTTLDHIIYGLPHCLVLNVTTTRDCIKWSTFTNLYQSANSKDFEATVKWIVVTYEKLRKFL